MSLHIRDEWGHHCPNLRAAAPHTNPHAPQRSGVQLIDKDVVYAEKTTGEDDGDPSGGSTAPVAVRDEDEDGHHDGNNDKSAEQRNFSPRVLI